MGTTGIPSHLDFTDLRRFKVGMKTERLHRTNVYNATTKILKSVEYQLTESDRG